MAKSGLQAARRLLIITRMPTVLRDGPYRVYFYSHEPHEPPHVHVAREQVTAKVWLNPVRLAANHGFARHELTGIVNLVLEHKSTLLDAWHEFHADEDG